jgi:CheY-like chemotaxis protein
MAALEGLRVLVVEDEVMVSLELQDILLELGCGIAGAAGRLREARALAHEADCDLAVLNIDLCGDRADDVADLLAARGVPFIFATGYGEERIAERHRSAPLVEKPYTSELLRRALLDIVPA